MLSVYCMKPFNFIIVVPAIVILGLFAVYNVSNSEEYSQNSTTNTLQEMTQTVNNETNNSFDNNNSFIYTSYQKPQTFFHGL